MVSAGPRPGRQTPHQLQSGQRLATSRRRSLPDQKVGRRGHRERLSQPGAVIGVLSAEVAHGALARALESLRVHGWDEATGRYAREAWAKHCLGSGDGPGAVRALGLVEDPARPAENRDRWDAHQAPLTALLGADHPDTLTTRSSLAYW